MKDVGEVGWWGLVTSSLSSTAEVRGSKLHLNFASEHSTPLRDMSSGFVSGGTVDAPIERDEEWRQAQREIEEKRREKEELGKQNEGKSLYEILQANKGDTASYPK